MILDYLIFGTALIGSGVAAGYDLKTTEVPNWVFYAMMIVGIPADAVLENRDGVGRPSRLHQRERQRVDHRRVPIAGVVRDP